ncbi:MAG TPA: hypothetical protein VMU89_21215 [Thermomicrobiaceae bacterium]|nr:hypothetical protein [Thermomicrobiaceae bacterium]
MHLWQRTLASVGLLVIVGAGCGHATPVIERGPPTRAATAATPPTGATSAAGTAVTTSAPTGTPVSTPQAAAARALEVERSDPWADHPRVIHVEALTLGEAWAAVSHLPQPPPGDPSLPVWWVDFSGTFRIPSCPAPPAGTPSTGCGTSTSAVLILAANDGHAIDGFIGARDIAATPAPDSLSLPSQARLKTASEATAAGVHAVPGKDGKPPTLVNLRLLPYGEWHAEEAARGAQPPARDVSTPVWELEFVNASRFVPCNPPPGGCQLDRVFIAFDALTGELLDVWGSGSQPPSPSPSPTRRPTPTAADQPTPAIGGVIALPASQSGDLTLVRTTRSPTFSQQAAMQLVEDLGVPFGLGGDYLGKPVTVTAAYGLGTFGHWDPVAGAWIGDLHIPLKGTDIVLDHIEHRPMWILDYGNVVAYGSQTTFNHAVYAVDEETRTVLLAWFYQGA